MPTPGDKAAAVLRGIGTGFGSTEPERAAAQKTVCHFAADATEAAALLRMLGLIDEPQRDPGRCRVCGVELTLEQMSPKWGLKGTCGRTCKRRMLEEAA